MICSEPLLPEEVATATDTLVKRSLTCWTDSVKPYSVNYA